MKANSKLANAVSNIAVRKVVYKALRMRRVCAGEFLECVGKVNNLQFSFDDFGDCYHTASSEPYFYDESYALCKPQKAIVVDECGRCVIAQEIDK